MLLVYGAISSIKKLRFVKSLTFCKCNASSRKRRNTHKRIASHTFLCIRFGNNFFEKTSIIKLIPVVYFDDMFDAYSEIRKYCIVLDSIVLLGALASCTSNFREGATFVEAL